MENANPTWRDRVEAAKLRLAQGVEHSQIFTDDDKTKAKDWVTCACGEQDPRIPRFGKHDPGMPNAPMDTALRQYGVNFAIDVHFGDPNGAEKHLEWIEKRSGEIIAYYERYNAL